MPISKQPGTRLLERAKLKPSTLAHFTLKCRIKQKRTGRTNPRLQQQNAKIEKTKDVLQVEAIFEGKDNYLLLLFYRSFALALVVALGGEVVAVVVLLLPVKALHIAGFLLHAKWAVRAPSGHRLLKG